MLEEPRLLDRLAELPLDLEEEPPKALPLLRELEGLETLRLPTRSPPPPLLPRLDAPAPPRSEAPPPAPPRSEKLVAAPPARFWAPAPAPARFAVPACWRPWLPRAFDCRDAAE